MKTIASAIIVHAGAVALGLHAIAYRLSADTALVVGLLLVALGGTAFFYFAHNERN